MWDAYVVYVDESNKNKETLIFVNAKTVFVGHASRDQEGSLIFALNRKNYGTFLAQAMNLAYKHLATIASRLVSLP